MPTKFIYIETSTTERRTYVGGASQEEHRSLLEAGYRLDRLANQYRKTTRVSNTVTPDGEIA